MLYEHNSLTQLDQNVLINVLYECYAMLTSVSPCHVTISIYKYNLAYIQCNLNHLKRQLYPGQFVKNKIKPTFEGCDVLRRLQERQFKVTPDIHLVAHYFKASGRYIVINICKQTPEQHIVVYSAIYQVRSYYIYLINASIKLISND